ncbi:UNVERIFIED_CONTAM: G-protein coupled receptor 1 [Sesamum latifolium]|uniref:G-protein coupled receptor 1 n=1 Tax=Sesamum latifolium TaxID=2727402 RepID=A0AAW2WZH3_9LAMI
MATLQAVLGNLTATERGILTTINTGASSLSLVGSGFIVLCYLLFKELRKFSFKLVFFLALSDMFCSFFGIIGDPSKGYFCYAQGYTTHFFCVASFLWTTTIAFTLHRTVVRHKTDVEDLEPMFHLYVWGGSLCNILCTSVGAILFNAITYFQVIRMLKNATRMAAGMSDRAYQSDVRPDMKALNRWGYYPLILIGSWFFGTINRIHDFIEPGHKIFWLSVLDVGMAALMGLFNSIAYGLNSSVRRVIYERLNLLPESFRRLPRGLRLRDQQQESELVSLKTEEPR